MLNIRENVNLAEYTTFKIGGVARYFIEVPHVNEIGAALDFAMVKNLKFIILGGGSNVLVNDKGFNGVVIWLLFNEYSVSSKTLTVKAQAGRRLSDIVFKSASSKLSGLEKLYGIPGTVGGAIRGNAGAFGSEMKDVVQEVSAVNSDSREVRIFSNLECLFTYRNSFFKQNPNWIILSATLNLKPSMNDHSFHISIATLAQRNLRQIQNIKSAGSFFLNPVVDHTLQNFFKEDTGNNSRNNRVPAGWLIDESGYKNKCVKDACTGKYSANYVINKSDANAEQIVKLTTKIQEAVLKKFKVELTSEVTQIGFEDSYD